MLLKMLTLVSLAIPSLALARVGEDTESTVARLAIHWDDSNVDGKVAVIARLDENGTATFEKWSFAGFSSSESAKLLDQGSTEVTEDVFENIYTLSNAHLDIQQRRIVCMMMPLPGPRSDLVVRRGFSRPAGIFRGELQTVETEDACWRHQSVHLVSKKAEQAAVALRIKLELLARSVFGE